MKSLPELICFQWDKGNVEKNWSKHKVSQTEAEEVFFDPYKMISQDVLHSNKEHRSIIIGATKHKRILFIVFTTRGKKIRIISARDYGHGKQSIYHKNKEKYEKTP